MCEPSTSILRQSGNPRKFCQRTANNAELLNGAWRPLVAVSDEHRLAIDAIWGVHDAEAFFYVAVWSEPIIAAVDVAVRTLTPNHLETGRDSVKAA